MVWVKRVWVSVVVVVWGRVLGEKVRDKIIGISWKSFFYMLYFGVF